ncbi:Putative peptidoglycan binding domain-containing protein [Arboricoccus pini]|uniref:Putative peptidoglycan binding domain-containing protein n=2 Tax=Arboricoccus pini TaxID=1963835 RepID=A0A212R4F2_9PROT|nr:Putative peptidoglycan binding domain-containing protein [Arboricoccus pini]
MGCLLAAAVSAVCPAQAQSEPQDAATDINVTQTTIVDDRLNVWEKRLVQEGLILLGYYNGFADGVFGSGTHAAIATFQRNRNEPATSQLTGADALDLAATALSLRKKIGWQSLKTGTGISMSYPAALLVNTKATDDGGEIVESADGDISLMTTHIPDASANGINALFDSMVNNPKQNVTYTFHRPTLFILSGVRNGAKFYTRMEQRGHDIRGYDLVWSIDHDDIMPSVSLLISNDFYPFGGGLDPSDETYPTLEKLAHDATQGGQGPDSSASAAPSQPQASAQSQAQVQPQTQQAEDQDSNDASSNASDNPGVAEQSSNALPPPEDGSLVTSDGKGLRFTYEYLRPKNPQLTSAYNWAVRKHLFRSIPEIDALDGIFVLPHPLSYVATECGSVNAFYTKKHSAVVLCYEMIDNLMKMGMDLAKGAQNPDALTVEFVYDNIRFILLHESGHAMIDLLDLPTVGREEDSADQLAAVLLFSRVNDSESENDVARVSQLVATWFKVDGADAPTNDNSVYADEHGLDAQRYYNLLCYVYGRDPDHFINVVKNGLLPQERADRCPDEAAKITNAWARLLLPNFAPAFKPKDAASGNANPAPAVAQSQPKNPLEWDGKSNPFGN